MTDTKWSDRLTEDHPVEWSDAGDGSVRYCTLTEALRRLSGYGFDRDSAHRNLLAGHTLSTTFARYRMPKVGQS